MFEEKGYAPMTQSRKKGKLDAFWNFLSILGVLGIFGIIIFLLMVFNNPASTYNPFPPPTLPVPVILPTSTVTPYRLPATWTPTVGEAQLFQLTTTPTAYNPTQLPGGELIIETLEISTAEVDSGYYEFSLQSAPAPIDASILKPDLQSTDGVCTWMGVGGQVLDIQGSPYTGIGIQLGGQMNGSTVLLTSLTGTALQYGPAGYEFKISDAPYATVHNFWLRLVDQANLPLSERIYFDTYESCDKNLIIINLKQVKK
jgi:hypothetical protein